MEELSNRNSLKEYDLIYFVFSTQRDGKSPEKYEYILTWKEYPGQELKLQTATKPKP